MRIDSHCIIVCLTGFNSTRSSIFFRFNFIGYRAYNGKMFVIVNGKGCELEALTAVVMKSSVLLDITPW
jgi:hypothetical protein